QNLGNEGLVVSLAIGTDVVRPGRPNPRTSGTGLAPLARVHHIALAFGDDFVLGEIDDLDRAAGDPVPAILLRRDVQPANAAPWRSLQGGGRRPCERCVRCRLRVPGPQTVGRVDDVDVLVETRRGRREAGAAGDGQ